MVRVTSGIRGLVSGAGTIAVAIAAMNVSTYAFTMIAARLLGPQAYGALAGLMATLLVIGVLQLGLQTTAARRIAAEPEHSGAIERAILRVGTRAALGIGALMLVLTPVVDRLLKLDSLLAAALVAVVAVPMTLMGAQAGILQGRRQWLPLALVYLANGLPRLAIGAALMWWRPDEATAMVAVAIGQWAPVLVGAWALRRLPAEPDQPAGAVESDRSIARGAHDVRAVFAESITNSQALFAFLALSNLDIIVARNLLDGHDAGVYAGGLIMTKAVLFLPQFVVVLAFPAMSTSTGRRRALLRGMALVVALGAVATLAGWLLADLALVFVGGDEYAEIRDLLWLFAVLGTALALLQLLVYSVVARQGRRSILLVWAAMVAVVGLAGLTDSVEGLITVVVAVDVVLVVALLALNLFRLGRDVEPEPATR